MTNPGKVAKVLGHEFRNGQLAVEALTHSTLINEPAGKGRTSNTRLAHLGDAVVELAVRSALLRRFPVATPKQLSEAEDTIVTDAALANAAPPALAELLERGGSRPADNKTVLSEVFEAAVGAIFLDSDYETAAGIVLKHVTIPTSL